MRGGKFLNQWRMAELHAKEAPDRVRELEEWGAVFDRTQDGRINQRNFGGHRYPRLAHVGDRTGLEMIRTLQDHGVHRACTSYMECTSGTIGLLMDGGRMAGCVRLLARDSAGSWCSRPSAVMLATGGIGKAWKASRRTPGSTRATASAWPTTPAPS
jgi:succinate dehydrogenase / fumarate reductase flavoprotein subunit